MKHKWTASYPRGSWPLFTCEGCRIVKCPTSAELNSDTPPSWWNEKCTPLPPLSQDDLEWLTGTGRYGQ